MLFKSFIVEVIDLEISLRNMGSFILRGRLLKILIIGGGLFRKLISFAYLNANQPLEGSIY